jgi:hypothetical protein
MELELNDVNESFGQPKHNIIKEGGTHHIYKVSRKN